MGNAAHCGYFQGRSLKNSIFSDGPLPRRGGVNLLKKVWKPFSAGS